MEVEIIQNSPTSRLLEHAKQVSVFESDPIAFSQWLVGGSEESLKSRWRADLPRAVSIAHVPMQEHHGPLDVESADDSCSIGDLEMPSFSQFGHCAPLVARPMGSNAIDEKQDIIGRERLVRLLASQQAWYDARAAASEHASALLDLIEHQQSQWLQTNSAEM